jgi:hypothetical protein
MVLVDKNHKNVIMYLYQYIKRYNYVKK